MRAVFRPDPSRFDAEWWRFARARVDDCPAASLAVMLYGGPREGAVAYVPVSVATAALEWCATIPGWADPSGILPLPLRIDLDETEPDE